MHTVRRCLLIALIIGGTHLLASSAPSPAIASPLSGGAAARLVGDLCALVEPVDGLPSAAAVVIPPEFKWKHRRLGTGTYPAIATSAAGEPHVMFRVSPKATDLKHTWREGNAWHSETIFSAPDAAHLGEMVALAIGSDGALHVAFTTWDSMANSGELHYAQGDGAGWQIETVAPDGSGSMSIAVDDTGVPHILHLVGSPSDEVRYLTREPGGWTGETIAASEYPHFGSALQVHDSTPYAAFKSGGSILLAVGEPGGWTLETVAGGTGSTFAFDAAGVLHVASVEWGGSHALVHRTLTESGWTNETLVDEATLFGEPAPTGFTLVPDWPVLTADASGRIRLAFGLELYKGAKYGKALVVAFLEEGAWLPFVAGNSLMGSANSIATDAAGIAHVATLRSVPGGSSKMSVHEYTLRGSKLSLAVIPKGSGTIGVAPLGFEATGKSSVSVFPGDSVTLTATAGDGFEFSGWSGAISGTDPVVELTMDHASKVIAHFAPTVP